MSVPKADKIVRYISYPTPSGKPNGVLHIFGDASSSKIAILCAGFPDDHTVFLPFAQALSQEGILVGVMCLPGYDHRPEDGVHWENHPRKGFTYDETAKAVQEASNALRGVSTCHPENPEFIGIFHDWGVIAGCMWAERAELEARDNPRVLKPNKIVFFDVLVPPSKKTPGYIRSSEAPRRTLYQTLCCLYQLVYVIGSAIQLYLPRPLAAAFVVLAMSILHILGFVPLDSFDFKSTDRIYGDRKPGLLRRTSMMYMYRNVFTSEKFMPWRLHQDWKTTPILYMYGKQKRTIFHAMNSLTMLEREEAEQRSLSRVVGVGGAGHWLYVQKQEECLKHVVEFIRAENTFATNK